MHIVALDASNEIWPKQGLDAPHEMCQLDKGSALDIPAGYGSQQSGVRSQNGGRIGVE